MGAGITSLAVPIGHLLLLLLQSPGHFKRLLWLQRVVDHGLGATSGPAAAPGHSLRFVLRERILGRNHGALLIRRIVGVDIALRSRHLSV